MSFTSLLGAYISSTISLLTLTDMMTLLFVTSRWLGGYWKHLKRSLESIRALLGRRPTWMVWGAADAFKSYDT